MFFIGSDFMLTMFLHHFSFYIFYQHTSAKHSAVYAILYNSIQTFIIVFGIKLWPVRLSLLRLDGRAAVLIWLVAGGSYGFAAPAPPSISSYIHVSWCLGGLVDSSERVGTCAFHSDPHSCVVSYPRPGSVFFMCFSAQARTGLGILTKPWTGLTEPFPVKDMASGAGCVVGVVETVLSFWLL